VGNTKLPLMKNEYEETLILFADVGLRNGCRMH
jgi:hypothetical protein